MMTKKKRDNETLWWFTVQVTLEQTYESEIISQEYQKLLPRTAKILGPRLGLGGQEAVNYRASLSYQFCRSIETKGFHELYRALSARNMPHPKTDITFGFLQQLNSEVLKKINEIDPKAIRSLIQKLNLRLVPTT